jgi:hypothetical protein
MEAKSESEIKEEAIATAVIVYDRDTDRGAFDRLCDTIYDAGYQAAKEKYERSELDREPPEISMVTDDRNSEG